MRSFKRALLALLVAAGLLAVAAGPASADSVFFDSDEFVVLDDDDATDDSTITVTANKGSIVFTSNDPIAAGTGCTPDGGTTVTCTGPDLSGYFVGLDDGNDTLTLNGPLGSFVEGNEGNDNITGSDVNATEEFLGGDDGNDIINSRNVAARDATIQVPILLARAARGRNGLADGFPGNNFPVGDVVAGDAGNDQLTTGNGDDDASGDDDSDTCFLDNSDPDTGTDVISTGSGDDFGSGGVGDGDQVALGDGNDFSCTFFGDGNGDASDGGAGLDVMNYDNTTFPENDEDVVTRDSVAVNLATGASTTTKAGVGTETDTAVNFDDVIADDGDDLALGNDASNLLGMGLGNDGTAANPINPGNGTDAVFLDDLGFFFADTAGLGDGFPAPNGTDFANVVDGFGDRVTCGPGVDTVQADQFDVDPNQDGNTVDSGVASDCEVVSVTAARAGGADVIAPDCTLARVKRSYGRTAFLRGFNVQITCSEAGNVTVQLLASFSRKLFPSKAGDVVLAQKTTTVTTGTAKSVRVKPLRKFRNRLRKAGFKTRLIVETQDQYGNRGIERKTVRVKKAKPKRKRRRR